MSYYEGFGVANPAIATENVFDGGIVAHDASANTSEDDSLFADGAAADALDIFGGGFQEAVGGMGAADFSQAMAGVYPRMYSGVGAVPSRVYSGMGAVPSRVYSGFGLDASKFDVAQIWAWFQKAQGHPCPTKDNPKKMCFSPDENAAGKRWAFWVKAGLAQLGFGISPTQEQLESGMVVSFGNDGIAALSAWRKANGYSSPYPFLDPRTKGKSNDELVLMKKQLEAGQQVGPQKPVSYDILEQPGAIVVATPTEQPKPSGLTIPGETPQQPQVRPPSKWQRPTKLYPEQPQQMFPVGPTAPSAAMMPGWTETPATPASVPGKKEVAPEVKPKLSTANMLLIGGAALAVGIAAFALFAKQAPKKSEASEPALLTPNKRGKKRSKKAHHRKARKSHKVR